MDYRDLNALTEQDAYPLPRIDDMLHRVARAKLFTTLDLQSGYHQIQIRQEDRPKTAFRLATPVRGTSHYEWKVMPFGLKNAPPTFQRYMSLILKDCTGFCDVYMDDIIVYSDTAEEHVAHVRTVLQTLRRSKAEGENGEVYVWSERGGVFRPRIERWNDLDATREAKDYC